MSYCNIEKDVQILGKTHSSDFPDWICETNFSDLALTNNLCLPAYKPSIESILQICASVCIETYNIICMKKNNKVFIEGMERIKIIYVANRPSQPVCSHTFMIPFCICVPLDLKHNYIIDSFICLQEIKLREYRCRNICICSLIFAAVKAIDKKCDNSCHNECDNSCDHECHNECDNSCDHECHHECHNECDNLYDDEWYNECDNLCCNEFCDDYDNSYNCESSTKCRDVYNDEYCKCKEKYSNREKCFNHYEKKYDFCIDKECKHERADYKFCNKNDTKKRKHLSDDKYYRISRHCYILNEDSEV